MPGTVPEPRGLLGRSRSVGAAVLPVRFAPWPTSPGSRRPAGLALALGVLVAYAASLDVFDQSTAEARTVATSTLVAIGLCYVIALEGGRRRWIAAGTVVPMAVVYVLVLALAPVRDFFVLTAIQPDMALCTAAGVALALGAFSPVWRRLREADG